MPKTKIFLCFYIFVLSSAFATDDCTNLLILNHEETAPVSNWIPYLKDHHTIAAFPPFSKIKKFNTSVYFPTNSSHLKNFPEIPSTSQAVLISMTGSGGENISGKNFMRVAKRMQQWGIAQISFDYPFHGEGPREERYNHVQSFRAMLFEIIKHYKKTGLPVILQGHSFGALVIQDLLHLSPDLVDGAVITSPGGNVTPALLEKYLFEFPPGQQAEIMKGFKWKFDPDSDKWAEGLDGKTGVAGQMQSNKESSKIKSPVQLRILAGDQDPYSTPELIEDFAKRFTHASYEIFPGYGHVDVNEAKGTREKAPMDAVLDLIEAKTGKKLELSKEAVINSEELFTYFLENSKGFRIYLSQVENVSLSKAWHLYEHKNISALEALLKRWNEFYLIQLWKALKTSSVAQEKAVSMNSANAKFFVFRDYSEMNPKQKEDFKRALYNFPLSDLDSN